MQNLLFGKHVIDGIANLYGMFSVLTNCFAIVNSLILSIALGCKTQIPSLQRREQMLTEQYGHESLYPNVSGSGSGCHKRAGAY